MNLCPKEKYKHLPALRHSIPFFLLCPRKKTWRFATALHGFGDPFGRNAWTVENKYTYTGKWVQDGYLSSFFQVKELISLENA